MEARREGMLLPEFQDWYPNLQAGKWYRANELTGMKAIAVTTEEINVATKASQGGPATYRGRPTAKIIGP